jgi:hypothetical protein
LIVIKINRKRTLFPCSHSAISSITFVHFLTLFFTTNLMWFECQFWHQ